MTGKQRLSYVKKGVNTVLVYDDFDLREVKMPVAKVIKRYRQTSKRTVYSIYLNNVYHSRHVSMEEAQGMLHRLFPLQDKIEWLYR